MKVIKWVLSITGIAGTLYFLFIVFGIILLGDRYCDILIKNGSEGLLILKTFQYKEVGKQLTVDSLALESQEIFKIGHCINCSTPDTTDIDFQAIGIFKDSGEIVVYYGYDLIKFLSTKKQEGCLTYIF